MVDHRVQVGEAAVVVEAALGADEQAARAASCGSDRPGERLAWKSSMPISAAVCIGQPGSVKSGGTWQVAHCALPLEHRLAALRRRRVEGVRRRLRRGDGQLVEVQRRELRA